MYAYHDHDHDPLGRGPKSHRPISSQPSPSHPNNSADDTSFRPTPVCSQPMFPDASFDVSTNKSTATSSHRRPLQSPNMPPPPLPPNNPSMYSRSAYVPAPTSVYRDDRYDDSHVPPSPMQIVMSRQSASTSQSREAREPHNDGYYYSPKVRGVNGREEREPPSPTGKVYYHDSYDRQYLNNTYHCAYEQRENHSGTRNNGETKVQEHQTNGYTYKSDYDLRNYSIETYQRCNCENCRLRQQHDTRYYDERDGCLHKTHRHHDVNQSRHDRMRDQSRDHTDRREWTPESPYANRGARAEYDIRHNDGGYGNERRTQPPESPLSPLTFDERRHAWSPTSDNATLHADTFQVPHYVTSTGSNDRREYRMSQDYAKRGQYEERVTADDRQHQYHHDENRRESKQRGYHYDGAHNGNGHIPTHVSYQSQESRPEQRYSNTSPDRRDDYSGSTIPTYSTVTPRRTPCSHQDYRAHQDARYNLRVDIPRSSNDPSNAQYLGHHKYDHQQSHEPPSTSRSSGNRSIPTMAHHNQPPYSTRSDPLTRVAIAQKEREKSEARHQILKEIHQATDMRKSALDDNDRRFWDRQIATLNESFKNL